VLERRSLRGASSGIPAALLLVALVDCSGESQPPSLSLISKPTGIDDKGAVAEISITAVDGQGQPGKGAVKVTSTAGSLRMPETVTLDAEGKASVGFSCVRATDALCKERVRVVGEWVNRGVTVSSETRVSVGAEFSTGPRLVPDWRDAGLLGPCLPTDAGEAQVCTTDMDCRRGFTCVFNAQGGKECVLKGGTGDVQATLRFRDPVDLDLHVFEPADGGSCHIFFGARGPRNACGSIGALDLDSNAACNIDNVNVENVIYPTGRRAPLGEYAIEVNYWSECSIGRAVPWQIEIRAGGELRYWCGSFATNEVMFTTPVTKFGLSLSQ